MTTSFAYIHCKPDGTPFYVGKGSLRRAKYLGERNPYHRAITHKYGRENILIGMLECTSNDIAFDLEKGIIKCLRSQGIKLTNFTDGGEGCVNPCPETRLRMSEAAKKRGVSKACQDAKVIAKRGKPLSEEQKRKQSESMRGIGFSDEHRKNISISAKKRGISSSVRAAAKKAIQKRVVGLHPVYGRKTWDSAKSVAVYLKAPISTTSKKIAAQVEYLGWHLRYEL